MNMGQRFLHYLVIDHILDVTRQFSGCRVLKKKTRKDSKLIHTKDEVVRAIANELHTNFSVDKSRIAFSIITRAPHYHIEDVVADNLYTYLTTMGIVPADLPLTAKTYDRDGVRYGFNSRGSWSRRIDTNGK